jgi:hypothetical protein
MTESHKGQRKLIGECLCGSVKFEITAPFRKIVSCYCSECRKTSGNFVSATAVYDDQIRYIEQCGLSWFSTEKAKRGFCQLCGSSLLWKNHHADGKVSVMAGCLEVQTGLKVEAHIFTADKSDFHEISSGAPQFEQDYIGKS